MQLTSKENNKENSTYLHTEQTKQYLIQSIKYENAIMTFNSQKIVFGLLK